MGGVAGPVRSYAVSGGALQALSGALQAPPQGEGHTGTASLSDTP